MFETKNYFLNNDETPNKTKIPKNDTEFQLGTTK